LCGFGVEICFDGGVELFFFDWVGWSIGDDRRTIICHGDFTWLCCEEKKRSSSWLVRGIGIHQVVSCMGGLDVLALDME